MGISPTQLLIILIIVALIFGTKKLRNMGSDLGGAVKGFKKAMNDDEKKSLDKNESGTTIEGKAETVEPQKKVDSEKEQK